MSGKSHTNHWSFFFGALQFRQRHMATPQEQFGERAKPVDLEAEEAAGEVARAENKSQSFPIGEIVHYATRRDSGHGYSSMDVASLEASRQWRVKGYDSDTKLYTVEFLGQGGGEMQVTEARLERDNPKWPDLEREERIRNALKKDPGDTLH
jgi:hypothetical protein